MHLLPETMTHFLILRLTLIVSEKSDQPDAMSGVRLVLSDLCWPVGKWPTGLDVIAHMVVGCNVLLFGVKRWGVKTLQRDAI